MRNQKDAKQDFIHRAFLFSIAIIQLTEKLPNIRSCWIIADQLIRAATSIGANIIEAKSASSKKDYINFYTHALKSANETKYWLALLKATNTSLSDIVNPLLQEVTELANILAASILTMKNKKL